MDIGMRRILLIADATIGNDFIRNEELGSLLMRMQRYTYREILVLKNTQASFMGHQFSDMFTVKAFPKKSIKKAIKNSSMIIYLTDGKSRKRKNSIEKRVRNQITKSIIKIVA